MAKVRRPLQSDAARGRMDDIVFSHDAGGKSIVRKHKDPSNPRTALQVAQREKFKSAQGMYLRGFRDYPSVLNASGQALLPPYLSAVAAFKQKNPVDPKKFANGFESGRVLDRDYAIGHSLRGELLVRKLDNGQIKNTSSTSITVVSFAADGSGLAPTTINAGASASMPTGAVVIAVTKSPFAASNWNTIDDIGTTLEFSSNNTELIVLSSMQEFIA